MTEATLTLNELSTLLNKISEHKGADRLSSNMIPEKQESTYPQLINTLIENANDKAIILTIIKISFHISRFGHTSEIQNNYLTLLSLCKDTETCVTNEDLQTYTLNTFLTLATTRHENNTDIHRNCQLEIGHFMNSKFNKISEKATLYFLDTITNKHFNILKLPEFLVTPEFITSLIKSIKRLLIEGPTKYNKLSDTAQNISSEYILTKFLNQLVHGPLGLIAKQQHTQINIEILNTLNTLLDYKPESKDLTKSELQIITTYQNLLNSSASKALFKFSETLYNYVNNPDKIKTPGNQTSEELITTIKTLTPLLKKIKNPKLTKPLPPIISTLELFSN